MAARCRSAHPTTNSMSRATRQRRQFRIERLEDRVVPGCLLWNGGLLDEDIDAVAASFSAEVAPVLPIEMAAPALQASANIPVVERRAPEQLPVSPQAEELLRQLDRELTDVNPASQKPADSLLESIDERFNIRPTPAAGPLSATDRLLLEINRELPDQTSAAAPFASGSR